MASEINSAGHLERRFKTIVSETPNRPNSRWMQACVVLCALVVLPLGVEDVKTVDLFELDKVGEALRGSPSRE